MFKKRNRHYFIEEFEELGIGTAYTTYAMGDIRDIRGDKVKREEFLKEMGLEGKKLIYGNQTHSINVEKVDSKISELTDDCDGFITKEKDVLLFTAYADCLPIYVYDKKNRVIGSCHAGWKGSFDGIQVNLIDRLKEEFDSKVEDLIIALGIGIAMEDYEVGKEFVENYRAKYGDEIVEKVFTKKEDKFYYNNIEFNKIKLVEKGVLEENIVCGKETTFDKEFHSFRRDKEKSGRNGAFIWFK